MVNAPPLSDRHSLSGSLSAFVDDCRTLIDRSLSFILPRKSQVSSRLMKAMHYSVFNGGKRIRPILALAACRAAGGAPEQAMPAACAVELIHAYSLVHDDLPAMDDDDLRRGKPSCHKAFDEATAILVGDTLQSLAFETLSNNDLCPAHHLDETTRLQLVRTLSQASGLSGMAGGQAMDNDAMGTQLSQQQLELMHSQKTGALINASVRMGSLCAKRDGQRITDLQSQQLNKYSQAIGLAFQVQDDILDVIADTGILGKQQGADIALDKPTYVSLMGLEKAREYTEELHQKAVGALEDFDGSADRLRQIAHYIVQRNY